MAETIAKRYTLVRQLGQGGMADVFLAIDTVLNREVAIKILRGDLGNDAVALLRFQREANAASRLNHPNIVEIYDVGEDNGRQYIVMEYVRGKTLKQLISARGALHKEEAVSIMKQLVSSVMEAHKHGIIHRDIKPQNILMKDDGTVKMTDFGIALAQDAVQLTQTDSVMGSVHYLAPELARGETATQQSDIYSLGIVFYELLTGEVPYRGDAPVQVALKHMRDEIPSILSFNPTLPQSLENIVMKSTVKNKAFRYRTAKDMLDDLSTSLLPSRAKEEKIVFDTKDDDKTIMIQQVSKMDNSTKEKNVYSSVLGIGLIIMAIIGLIFIAILTTNLFGNNKKSTMPNVIGKTLDEAQVLIEENNLVLDTSKIIRIITDDIEKGLIVETNPQPDTKVERGYVVTLTISSGKYVVVKDYVGRNYEEVKKELDNTKLRIRVEYEQNPDVPVGNIIRQELQAPNTKLDPDRVYEIKFIVSASLEFIIPNNIIGMDVFEAQSVLQEMGGLVDLYPLSTEGMTEDELAVLKRNSVVKVSPAVGSLYVQKEGAKITLYYY